MVEFTTTLVEFVKAFLVEFIKAFLVNSMTIFVVEIVKEFGSRTYYLAGFPNDSALFCLGKFKDVFQRSKTPILIFSPHADGKRSEQIENKPPENPFAGASLLNHLCSHLLLVDNGLTDACVVTLA